MNETGKEACSLFLCFAIKLATGMSLVTKYRDERQISLIVFIQLPGEHFTAPGEKNQTKAFILTIKKYLPQKPALSFPICFYL